MAYPRLERPPPYNSQYSPKSCSLNEASDSSANTSGIPTLARQHDNLKRSSDVESQVKLVGKNFASLRKRLNQTEKWIIESLETSPEDRKLAEQRENLSKTKENLEESMKDPHLASTLADSFASIQTQLTRLDKQIHARKYLKWNMRECENAIENVCTVYEAEEIMESHMLKRDLLWEKVRPGSERTQVLKPVGLAIEPTTDRIFVADAGNKRIQIFNCDGEHLSQLSLEKITNILFFSFIGKHLFLIEEIRESLTITKAIPNTENVMHKIIRCHFKVTFPAHSRTSKYLIDLKRNDSRMLTICFYLSNHKIWAPCYYIADLTKVNVTDKQIELHSPHIKDYTTALDVKIVGSSYELTQFYVLYKNASFAVQVFNLSGEVVRAIIPLKLENGISQFLIDEENNIIISNVDRFSDANPETGAQNLYTNYVLSSDGVKKHKWTYRSENRDTFIRSILKPFQKKQPVSSATNDVIQDAPVFAVCLNSKQNLVLLYNLEKTFMLRAF